MICSEGRDQAGEQPPQGGASSQVKRGIWLQPPARPVATCVPVCCQEGPVARVWLGRWWWRWRRGEGLLRASGPAALPAPTRLSQGPPVPCAERKRRKLFDPACHGRGQPRGQWVEIERRSSDRCAPDSGYGGTLILDRSTGVGSSLRGHVAPSCPEPSRSPCVEGG